MKVAASIAILVVGLAPFVVSDKCHLRELDLCAASAAGVAKVPATDADIDKYCSIGQEAKECVNTYTAACATPVQKEIIAWATKDPLKSSEEFCKKGSKVRTDYLKHAPCLAKAQPEGKKCIDDIHAGLEKLEKAKFSDRIPTACCLYQRYQKCSTEVVEAQCGKESIEFGLGLLQRNSGTTLSVLCQGFENNPRCEGLLPPPGTKASGNSKSIVSKLFSAYVNS